MRSKYLKNILRKKFYKLKSYILFLSTWFLKLNLSNKRQNKDQLNLANLNRGYLYTAFGKVFLKECILSAKSLKRFTNYPIHLFTDQKESSEELRSVFTSITYVPSLHLRSKVDYIHLSPFDETIYVDTDVVVVYQIDELFNLLKDYPLLATLDTARKRKYLSLSIPEYEKIPYAFGEINSGLMAFNNYAKETIMSKWPEFFYKYYDESEGWDQPSLRILLWKYKVPVYILPPEYNIRSKMLMQKLARNKEKLGEEHMKPRIYHMHATPDIHKGIYPDLTLEELEDIVIKNTYEISY